MFSADLDFQLEGNIGRIVTLYQRDEVKRRLYASTGLEK
jgi:hypothetical protein